MDEQQTASTPSSDTAPEQTKTPTKTLKIPKIIGGLNLVNILIGVIVGVILVGGGYLFYGLDYSKTNKPSSSDNESTTSAEATPSANSATPSSNPMPGPSPIPDSNQDNNVDEEYKDWKIFSSPNRNVEFRYPPSWDTYFIKDVRKEWIYTENAKFSALDNVYNPSEGIVLRIWEPEKYAYQDKYQDMITYASSSDFPYKESFKNSVGLRQSIDGEDAFVFETWRWFEAPQGNSLNESVAYVTFVLHKGNIYTIEFIYPKGHYDRHQPTIYGVMSTFKFLD